MLRLLSGGLLTAALPAWSFGTHVPPWSFGAHVPPRSTSVAERRLFFDPAEADRIRANRTTELLQPVFETWRNENLDAGRRAIDAVAETHDTVGDLADAMRTIRHQSVVYLATQDAARRDLIEHGIRTILELPAWDFLREGDGDVLGLQRASLATVTLLFAREVLGDALSPDVRDRLLPAIAEKGCLPCYRALWGMQYPEQVEGWRFDEMHRDRYNIDMSRWPIILDETNLKAIPIMGLGVGALALEGHDDRAELWLDLAVSSADEYLQLFVEDGSYFEGVSYADYSLRSLFLFFEAHYRTHGTVDWVDKANFYGVSEYLVAMQAGRKPNGRPDIVNFSDAGGSMYPAVMAWIANRTGDRLAQHATRHFTRPGYFADFLWYRPDQPQMAPPAALKNKRFDLDWIVVRTGWTPTDNVIGFRSGAPSNHEHADRNSFLFKAYGERLLTDHYGAAYDWRQPKWLLRQTEAHNSVLIDGEGHQYHDGREGTNSSKAHARVLRYVDNDDVVWWCSDATLAYQLVHPDVTAVQRTLLYAKPDIIVLHDRVEKGRDPSTMAVRFHPDNRDGAAEVQVGQDGRFEIRRPNAVLFGRTGASTPLHVKHDQLDLPEAEGVYPFIEASTESDTVLDVVTVLVARPEPAAGEQPTLRVEQEAGSWTVGVNDQTARIHVTGRIPEVEWAG